MSSMLQNWITAPNNDTKLKIIEILNMSCLPVETFFNILSEAFEIKPQKKKKSNQLEFIQSFECQIIHLSQVFTHYSFQNFRVA